MPGDMSILISEMLEYYVFLYCFLQFTIAWLDHERIQHTT